VGVDSSGPNEPLLAEGPDLPKEMGNLGGQTWACPDLQAVDILNRIH